MENKKSFEVPIPIAIIIAGAMLSGAFVYKNHINLANSQNAAPINEAQASNAELEESVLPSRGIELPITWGDLGKKMTDAGVIDREKFKSLYNGQLTDEEQKLLEGDSDKRIIITRKNSGYLLNMFWALGLSNKNPILDDKSEMKNPLYEGAANFASTGGWTVSRGDVMNHYNSHIFFSLTPEEQTLVDKMSGGIYRPCCGNPAHFPDCNHGMAMLGLLELMASQGVSEQEMWNAALAVNSYWFPDTYSTIASYMRNNGVDWKNVNASQILGRDFSSAQGYSKIALQVASVNSPKNGSGCGIN